MFLRYLRTSLVVTCVFFLCVIFRSEIAHAFPYDLSRSYSVRTFDYNRTSASEYGVFDSPVSAHFVDVDGDGDQDVATAGYIVRNVFISLNNGDGTYERGGGYPIGGSPLFLTSADIDDDGDMDLATGNHASGTFSILFNLGSGTFSSSTEYAVTDNPLVLAFADIDDDGDLDLSVTKSVGSTVAMYLNDGEGVFTTSTSYTVQNYPRFIVFADLDGDEDSDMGVANLASNSISVLLNNGNGTYATATSYASGGLSPIAVEAADVDGDDDLDLITTNADTGSLSILKNNGNGTFAAAQVYATDIGTSFSVVVGDLDGDGDPDLTTGTATDNSVHTFFNDGTGTFGGGERYQGGRTTNGFDLADADGDGDNDLVLSNGGADSITIMLNKGDGRFPQPTTYAAGAEFQYNVLAADVDNDGFQDVLLNVAETNNYPIAVLKNNGSGALGTPSDYSTGSDTAPYSFAASDVNGDGYVDLGVVLTYATSQSGFAIKLNNGDGTFGANNVYATGFLPDYFSLMGIEFADFDHDQDQDVMVTEYETAKVHAFLNNGAGVFTLGSTYTVGTNPFMLTLADLNGDGDMDAAVTNYGSLSVSLLFGNGNGTFASPVTYSDGFAAWVSDIGSGDLDDDGDIDLVVSGGVLMDAISVLMNNGNGTFATSVMYRTGMDPVFLIVTDLDYDDDLDIATAMYTFNSIGILINNGNGTFAETANLISGKEGKGRPYDLAAADLNNDGVKELLVANSQATTMSVIYSLLPPPPLVVVRVGGGGSGHPGTVRLPPVVTVFQTTDLAFLKRLEKLKELNLSIHQLMKLPDDGNLETQDDTAVYYIGSDGRRHAFPNGRVFSSWYTDFSQVKIVDASILAVVPLGANVTYKPGVRMVKFTTDPKTYLVEKGGALRWIASEAVAIQLYGTSWNTHIDDMDDAFFSNYRFGENVHGLADFDPALVRASANVPSESFLHYASFPL
jgi:hypothetical protein